MLEEIIEKYGKFSDSLVSEISYKCYITEKGTEDDTIEVVLRCMNFKNENKFERIKLKFVGVMVYKFSQNKQYPSLFLDEVYIKEEDGIITFDFFPIDYFDYLEENPNSEFIVKCKEVSYKVLPDN
jgi:hypothetical protein